VGLVIPSKPQYNGVAYDCSAGELLWIAPAVNAVWNDGDILANTTVGTIDYPAPNGSLAALPGPVAGVNLTTGVSASAGAPAQDYFGVASFTGGGGIESLQSLDFIISCPAGYLPTVLVTATATPAAATGFYAYLGVIPGTYFRQNIGGTALGTPYTAANPLTNYTGAINAPAGTSTGILGMANEGSFAYYAGYPGGSAKAGPRSLFGASQSMAPGWDNDGFKLPVLKMSSGLFAMNLLQAYNPGMDGQLAVGINIDTGNTFITGGTGFYIMDSTQTACATLISRLSQNPGVEANGDVGARCLFKFYPAALVA
jgi:hypothetical protein